MFTVTDVCNDAFLEIGVSTIVDVSDNSPQAIRANALFPRVVRAELRKHAWSCALDRAQLPAMSTIPMFGYIQQYQLPADFIRLWMVGLNYIDPILTDYVSGDDSAFCIEGTLLLCNESAPLPIRYIKDVQGLIQQWDTLFREIVILKLAQKLIPSTVKSETKYDVMGKEYDKIIKVAKRINAIELPPTPMSDNAWDMGRL